MHLVLVISSLKTGGAERVMATLASAWAARGWNIEILTTHDDGAPPDYPLASSVSLHPLATSGGLTRQFEIVNGLRRHISRSKPDCVVSFLVFTNILVLLATIGMHVPVVVSERLDPRVKKIGLIWNSLRRLLYLRAKRLVAQTPTAARLFKSWVPGGVRIIPNPVFSLAEQAGHDLEVDLKQPTILCVGRLMWQKGFDYALDAMAELPKSCEEWQMIILGDGPLKKELMSKRDQLGLTKKVHFPGRVENPWPWLKAADLFLLPSRTEGFPNALCEAMAAGMPVIATDCPSGPGDIIKEGVDGLLVSSGDVQEMTRALEKLIKSPDSRRRLGRSAIGITDRYSMASVLELWDSLLVEVTKQKPSPKKCN